MNKDCRQIWTGYFAKCKKCFRLCGQPLRKPRADTELSKDSRCSSVLTVLSPDPRGSELYGSQTLVDPKNRILPSFPLPRSVARLKAESVILVGIKPRASTLSLPAMMGPKENISNSTFQIPSSPNGLDPRSRSTSVPVILQQEPGTASTDSEQGRVNSYILSALSRDLEVSRSINSEDSDANSETDKFISKSSESPSPS